MPVWLPQTVSLLRAESKLHLPRVQVGFALVALAVAAQSRYVKERMMEFLTTFWCPSALALNLASVSLWSWIFVSSVSSSLKGDSNTLFGLLFWLSEVKHARSLVQFPNVNFSVYVNYRYSASEVSSVLVGCISGEWSAAHTGCLHTVLRAGSVLRREVTLPPPPPPWLPFFPTIEIGSLSLRLESWTLVSYFSTHRAAGALLRV